MKNKINKLVRKYGLGGLVCTGLVILFSQEAAASTSSSSTIGTIASNITATFKSVTKLITACSYMAGLGFAVGAIMKFKQHKDNPTQIPIGTPIALVAIAGALLFLPSILEVTSGTLFGTGGGSTGGPTGTVFTG